MKTFLLAPALVTSLALTDAATSPARAGGGDIGAGLIGGLAVGTIIGAAGHRPTLLSAATGLCSAGTHLLLDAPRAGMG
jgi:hypothetical protein